MTGGRKLAPHFFPLPCVSRCSLPHCSPQPRRSPLSNPIAGKYQPRPSCANAPPTGADTAAILRAASDSVWRFEGGFVEVVADTAWVMVGKTTETYRSSYDSVRGVASDTTTMAFDHRVSRIERRKGKWVLVRREP